MTPIPFPTGIEGFERMPRTRQRLENCFNVGETIIARPGIKKTGDVAAFIRGQFVWNDALYTVAGSRLLRWTNPDAGEFEDVGFIAGGGNVQTAIGFTHAIILIKGNSIYAIDRDDTLTDLSANPNYEPADSVAFMDDRFIFSPTSGEPVFFTDAASLDVRAENFFDAQELPDRNTVVFNHRNVLYVGGRDSIEMFRDVGGDPLPYQRLTGARMDYGYIGGYADLGDMFVFVGNETKLGPGIYSSGSGGATKISNEAIDEILEKYSPSELKNVVVSLFKWRGYEIVAWVIGDHAFCFTKFGWPELSVLVDDHVQPWRGRYIDYLDGKYWASGHTELGYLDAGHTEFGRSIPAIIDIAVQQGSNEWFSCQGVTMTVSQGYSEQTPRIRQNTIGIATSPDGVLFGPRITRPLPGKGNFSAKLDWLGFPGGLGSYNGFMALRISTYDAVEFSADKLFGFFRS